MPEWISQNDQLLLWGSIASVVMFFGTLVVIPIIIASMDDDYFMPGTPKSFANHHPALRAIGLIAKNLLGVVFVLIGIVMIFVPGQGLLTILMGLCLINFPGKRTAQLRLLRYPPIHKSIAWIRNRADKPPLQIPEEEKT